MATIRRHQIGTPRCSHTLPGPAGGRCSGMLGQMSDSLAGLLADAELAAFVAGLREAPGPPARQLGPVALREAQRKRVEARPRGPELAAVEDLVVPGGVVVRLYPPGQGTGPRLRP